MARPINMQIRNENLVSLEKAAKMIAAQGRPVTMSALAEELGCSRQHLYQSDYLKKRAEELIQEYAPPAPAPVEWSESEWKEKYRRLDELYQAKCRECVKLRAEREKIREERDTLERNIRRLRGELYQFDMKNRI